MKAITIWQPHASLIAIGEKPIETRGRRTSYRGPIAIHASKKWNSDLDGLCFEEPYQSVLLAHGFIVDDGDTPPRLPLACIVAIAQLTECEPVEAYRASAPLYSWPEHTLEFGDFTPGRFGLFLSDVRPLAEPIPAKGAQGLWEWTPPAGFVMPEKVAE